MQPRTNHKSSFLLALRVAARRVLACLMVLCLFAIGAPVFATSEHHGQVTFGGLPVPGATVTAAQGDKHLTTITDAQGNYQFPALDDGAWKIAVEMRGFETQTRDINMPADASTAAWELKLLPFEEITRGITITPPQPAAAPTPASP